MADKKTGKVQWHQVHGQGNRTPDNPSDPPLPYPYLPPTLPVIPVNKTTLKDQYSSSSDNIHKGENCGQRDQESEESNGGK
jgi:hypothetical protein